MCHTHCGREKRDLPSTVDGGGSRVACGGRRGEGERREGGRGGEGAGNRGAHSSERRGGAFLAGMLATGAGRALARASAWRSSAAAAAATAAQGQARLMSAEAYKTAEGVDVHVTNPGGKHRVIVTK